MRVLLICERLSGQDDEGIKNFARHALDVLARENQVLALSKKSWPGRQEVQAVGMNRFFLNAGLLSKTRRFAPDVVLYVPWTSGTPRTLMRGRVLRLAARAPIALVLTQPYSIPAAWSYLVRLMLPDMVMGMEEAVLEQFGDWGVHTAFVPGGVDLGRFDILPPEERSEVRTELGVTGEQRLVLHVGHLNRRRLDAAEVIALSREPRTKVLLVGSPDTPQDDELMKELDRAGCRVVREFLPRIERIYGAADLYWFPTTENRSSIGVPLSVLEALACGIPVISSRFGGLPRLFPSTPFVRFVSAVDDPKIDWSSVPPAANVEARLLVKNLDWQTVGKRVEALLGEACAHWKASAR